MSSSLYMLMRQSHSMTTAASPNPGATWHLVSLFLVVSLLAFKLHGAGPDEAK
jgi:hypothetical protein